MTVYNGGEYLKKCIESVLGQTFSDFEFLIVDDRSTDTSRDTINSYKNKRIRLIKNDKNLGQVKSLNIGLDNAHGEYIARMDQDDIMVKDRLKKQADFLDRNEDISLVGAWGEVIDENGKVFTKARLPIKNEEIIGTVLFSGFFLMHPAVMFRKDDVMQAGKYDEGITFSEDYNLWTRLLLNKRKLANIPEYLIKFRYHKNSSSRQFPETQVNNLRTSIGSFLKTITGNQNNVDVELLCNILINVGLMNKNFWSQDLNKTDLKKIAGSMRTVLEKTVNYFNLNKKEADSMKKIFCNRILNFTYETNRKERKKATPFYLFCLKNYQYIFLKPKLYLYPLKAVL